MMLDVSATNGANRETTTSDLVSDELQRLQLERLRLEVRDLQLQWWKRPAWFAAFATMIAALCGLIWAASTNYFETRIRELKLETRDLEARRDKQSEAFARERRMYEQRIAALKRDEAKLQGRITDLNLPTVSKLLFENAFWQDVTSKKGTRVLVEGSNFGSEPGQLRLSINVRIPNGGRELIEVATSVDYWQERVIVAKLDGLSEVALRTAMGEVVRSKKPESASLNFDSWTIVAIPSVRRSDGLESQDWYVSIDELTRRLIPQ